MVYFVGYICKVKKLIWIIPAALIAFYLFQRSRFNFRFVGFKVNPKPSITIQLLNPSQVPALLQSIVLDVYLKGASIGTITNFNQLTIPSNGAANISLDISLNSFGLVALATTIIKDGANVTKNVAIDIIGTVNVDGISLPVNEKYQIN
jgi:LEA14-like dessication related protein